MKILRGTSDSRVPGLSSHDIGIGYLTLDLFTHNRYELREKLAETELCDSQIE